MKVAMRNRNVSQNFPYGFMYKEELRLYKSVGNKARKGSPYLSKYSEWKNYINKKYIHQQEDDNFYRYLRRKQRACRMKYELLMGIALPVEVGIIAIAANTQAIIFGIEEKFVIAISLSIFLVGLFTYSLAGCKVEINFINDIFELIDEKKANEQNIVDKIG